MREIRFRYRQAARLLARTAIRECLRQAAADNLKLINQAGLTAYTTLKDKRRVRVSKAAGYLHLTASEWTAERREKGGEVKLKAVLFNVRLFKLAATNGNVDWVIANNPAETLTAPVVQDANDGRWQIEELHRERNVPTIIPIPFSRTRKIDIASH